MYCLSIFLRCDKDWTGDICETSVIRLPKIIAEDFSPNVDEVNWSLIVGGTVVKPCRAVAAGKAMHFSGVS